MARHPARYSVSFGLAGCYMPDSVSGPHTFDTRRELAAFIRGELEAFEMPKGLFRAADIRRLWPFIQRHGASVSHFNLHHGANVLAFQGLTEAEAAAMEGDE